MKKVLIAVDSSNGSEGILSLFRDMVYETKEIVLLHVEQLEGNALMTGMLSDSEITTLKEAIEGTEHKETLDRNASRVLEFYKNKLENDGQINIKTVIRAGNPSDEILKVTKEESVDLVIVGCSGKSRVRKFFTGCASRDVEENAQVPVLIAKGNGCGKHADLWNRREAYAIR